MSRGEGLPVAEGGGGRRWFYFEDQGTTWRRLLPHRRLCKSSANPAGALGDPPKAVPTKEQRGSVTHTLCPDSKGWWCHGELGWCWRVPTLSPDQAGALS